MTNNVSVVAFPYGDYSTDDWSDFLGMSGLGEDQDVIAGNIESWSNYGQREYVLVQNSSGGTLSTSQALKWADGEVLTGVTKCTAGAAICGYVPYSTKGSTTATIPADAYFWMVKNGPTWGLKTAAAVNETDKIEASGTAGSIQAATGTANYVELAGTFIADNSDGAEATRIYANCQW